MKLIIKGSRKEIEQYINDQNYQPMRDAQWDDIIKPTLVKDIHHYRDADKFIFKFPISYLG